MPKYSTVRITSYFFWESRKNFVVGHLAVCGNTVCGYSEDSGFQEGEFGRHIDGILKMDGHKGVTVKIFTSLSKYTERLDQMRELKEEQKRDPASKDSRRSIHSGCNPPALLSGSECPPVYLQRENHRPHIKR